MLGMIAVADVIKEDSPRAVKELQNMGIRVVMLTGDNERTARAIGAQAGVDEVIAGVLPDGKEAVISRLKEKGKVAMVGDGINDAPALTSADIGIAIGAGTDIAIDAADVVLMKSRLSDVPAAIRLSRATLRNIHENLFWAFIYNIIGIPLAAGVWIPLFGWKLNGKHQWYSDRKQTTIWEYDRPKASKEHPTMKPVVLMAYPIENSSMSHCIVLDLSLIHI